MTIDENHPLIKDALSGKITEAQFVEEVMKMDTDDSIQAIKFYGFAQSKGEILNFFQRFTAMYPDHVKKWNTTNI